MSDDIDIDIDMMSDDDVFEEFEWLTRRKLVAIMRR
jgi:hypothetical protein